ncbi:energy transducer TonB [Paludibacter jiangxiensis]|nr:energy transducer TonB [Paludibacter jiangxiensis]
MKTLLFCSLMILSLMFFGCKPKHSPESKSEIGRQTHNKIGTLNNIDAVELSPVFPEGDVDAYIQQHIHYPSIARERKKEGRVIVQFVINRDGSICNVEVIRGGIPELNEEAIRVVKSMPKWKPAFLINTPVRCRYVLAITFKLPPTPVTFRCPAETK